MTMKIEDRNGRKIEYFGMSQDKFDTLTEMIKTCLKEKPFAVVCITGNKGVGKTTLGKLMRKHGFGPFSPKDIAVIDDDCMSVDIFLFLRRKYVNPCYGVDELEPFFRYCKKKRVRIYVKSNPESRISQADILLKTHISDDKRKARLINRYGKEKGERVFDQTQSYNDQARITFRYELSAEIQ